MRQGLTPTSSTSCHHQASVSPGYMRSQYEKQPSVYACAGRNQISREPMAARLAPYSGNANSISGNHVSLLGNSTAADRSWQVVSSMGKFLRREGPLPFLLEPKTRPTLARNPYGQQPSMEINIEIARRAPLAPNFPIGKHTTRLSSRHKKARSRRAVGDGTKSLGLIVERLT